MAREARPLCTAACSCPAASRLLALSTTPASESCCVVCSSSCSSCSRCPAPPNAQWWRWCSDDTGFECCFTSTNGMSHASLLQLPSRNGDFIKVR